MELSNMIIMDDMLYVDVLNARPMVGTNVPTVTLLVYPMPLLQGCSHSSIIETTTKRIGKDLCTHEPNATRHSEKQSWRYRLAAQDGLPLHQSRPFFSPPPYAYVVLFRLIQTSAVEPRLYGH